MIGRAQLNHAANLESSFQRHINETEIKKAKDTRRQKHTFRPLPFALSLGLQ